MNAKKDRIKLVMWPIWTRLNNFLQFFLILIEYFLNISLAGLKYLSKNRKARNFGRNEKPHEILRKTEKQHERSAKNAEIYFNESKT